MTWDYLLAIFLLELQAQESPQSPSFLLRNDFTIEYIVYATAANTIVSAIISCIMFFIR